MLLTRHLTSDFSDGNNKGFDTTISSIFRRYWNLLIPQLLHQLSAGFWKLSNLAFSDFGLDIGEVINKGKSM